MIRSEYLRPWIATPGQALDFVDCGRPQRGITAAEPAGRHDHKSPSNPSGLGARCTEERHIHRKKHRRSKLRGMNPVAIQICRGASINLTKVEIVATA